MNTPWNINTGLGLVGWYLAVLFFAWVVAAIIRAVKTENLFHWPINGRWVLAGFILFLCLLFAEVAYSRLIIGRQISNYYTLTSRVMLAIFATWSLWRWLCGNLFEVRDINNESPGE